MYNKILDFIENHRKLCVVLIVIVVLFIIMMCIRSYNLSRNDNKLDTDIQETDLAVSCTPLPTATEIPEPVSKYQSSLGLDKDKGDDGRVEVKEDTKDKKKTPTKKVQKEPKYRVLVNIFDSTSVPSTNMDGSSCKAYLNGVSLKDFGTYWGSNLTDDDFKGGNKYLIGVEQSKDDTEKGDLESVGWLIDNFPLLNDNDAIKFTNLHVIGSLSDTHVALLCSYDWYSAFGLKDTLVVFEDISNTLNVSDFKDGDIFSATVFKHNVKIENKINGQRVVVVQYNTFK